MCAQAKKAGPDEVTKADSKGGSDAQLITNEVKEGRHAHASLSSNNKQNEIYLIM